MTVSCVQVSLACVVASVSSYPMAWPAPDGPPGPHGGLTFPKPGPDGAYAGDNYFQYINVPAPHTFEWGYRRGNPDHNREQYLSQKDHTFKAKVSCHCLPVLTLTLSGQNKVLEDIKQSNSVFLTR